MDKDKFPLLMRDLYAIASELEKMFGRPFTPDGHMVGSVGEALAAYHYGLTLTPPSTPGCDAKLGEKNIEIKATQGNRVAFRCEPEYLLVLKLEKDGSFQDIYNGHGARVWKKVAHKPMPSNGQHQMSLSTLKQLATEVEDGERISRVR